MMLMNGDSHIKECSSLSIEPVNEEDTGRHVVKTSHRTLIFTEEMIKAWDI